jgi:hypothetical protein
MVTLTAPRQAGERLATFFCRQRNASAPRMPGQVDIASDRQEARIASCCAGVGWASAGPASEMSSVRMAAAQPRGARKERSGILVVLFLPAAKLAAAFHLSSSKNHPR